MAFSRGSLVVVGGGIVGLATARRYLEVRGGSEVTVIDKEPRVAAHQSGHNSGVVHAGIYYAPGSLKATLCRRGRTLMREFCMDRGLPYDACGKVVVARSAKEVPALRELERRARENGVPGLRYLEASALAELEPHVAGVAALHSPETAIVDYIQVAEALARDVEDRGGRVLLATEVTGFVAEPGSGPAGLGGGLGGSSGGGAGGAGEAGRAGGGGGLALRGVKVLTTAGELVAERAVICAGLQSDRVARLAGDGPDPAIVPFRGEYHRLRADREGLIRGLVYPVPDPRYPFLGIHFTKRVGGGVDVGPNAVLALGRESYRRTEVDRRDLAELLAWPGTRRMALHNVRAGARELATSLSKQAFLAAARSYVPELRSRDLVPAPAGVRAQAVGADGSLVDDFVIHQLGAVLAVRNAPSPAATSSLAIAEHVVARLVDAAVA